MNLIKSNYCFRLISFDDQIKDFDCGNHSINSYLKNNSYYDTLCKNGSTTLVYLDSELVGFATLARLNVSQLETEVMIVQYLAVSSNKQDTGVGSTILEFIIEIALMTNETYVFLEALKDDDSVLIDWYTKRGFTIADPEELADSSKATAWMYINLEDEESLDKMFNEP